MSWTIEEYIGESRPWPAQVVVYRGETSESLAYVSGEVADRLKAENAKLRELVRLMVRRHTPISLCKNIACGECPVKDECDQEDALMRELGIEVNA